MGAESPVRLGCLSPRDPGVTGVVGEVWSGRRCTRVVGDHLPVVLQFYAYDVMTADL
jgi:hypothetical protein